MSNNFDLTKYLVENKLTTNSKALNEAPNIPVPGNKPNMPPVPGNKPKMPPVPGQAKPNAQPSKSPTAMAPENFAKFKEALKLLAQIAGKQGGIPDGLAKPLMKIMQTINLDNVNYTHNANEETAINEYEQHYEVRNGECRRYNDEGDYEVVSMSYCHNNEGKVNESEVNELHGGYLEVMGDDFHEAAKEIAKAWVKWRNGPATEPEDIEPAREDVIEFLKSMVR